MGACLRDHDCTLCALINRNEPQRSIALGRCPAQKQIGCVAGMQCPVCGANCTITIPVVKKTFSFTMPDCPIKARPNDSQCQKRATATPFPSWLHLLLLSRVSNCVLLSAAIRLAYSPAPVRRLPSAPFASLGSARRAHPSQCMQDRITGAGWYRNSYCNLHVT